MRKYYCDKVVWPLTQHRPLWILWLNSAFKLQAVLISDLQRPHHNTEALLQILATFWFKNKSLIPIFYILVNAFIHWTTLLAIPAAVRSFSLQEEGTTRNPLQDELEGMAGMKQGKNLHPWASQSHCFDGTVPLEKCSFLSSCIQDFQSPRKKPFLMTYLLKESHNSQSHSLFIILSIFQFLPYGLVIILWGCFALFCSHRIWQKTLGCERNENQDLWTAMWHQQEHIPSIFCELFMVLK